MNIFDKINRNQISNLIEPLHKIPHNMCDLDFNERKNYLKKIEDYVKNIEQLILDVPPKEKQKTDLNILNFGIPVFQLAYYGFSVKNIIEDYVSIYKNSFEHYINSINRTYKAESFYNKSYKKILFFSTRLCTNSSVYKSTRGFIDKLSRVTDFHIDLMTLLPIEDSTKNCFENCKNVFQIENIKKNIEKIGSGRYDMIIYPDMNMDPRSSCIGMFRLAPVQITTFGHSETSGIADYFLTSKYYEIEPENNYTEKAICFDSLCLDYETIKLENFISHFKSRQHFQIHKDSNVYFCNSSFFKFGKEMFDIFRKILDKDKKAVIILTKMNNSEVDYVFYIAMEKYLGLEYTNRIKFFSRLNILENMNLLYLSDVFIESYPFGNMNSTLECFAAGLPVITMPTNKINGRFTYGYYKKMGLDKEYCANNVEEYVEKAVSVACSKDKSKRQELLEKSKILFEEEKSSKDWENFIREVCK